MSRPLKIILFCLCMFYLMFFCPLIISSDATQMNGDEIAAKTPPKNNFELQWASPNPKQDLAQYHATPDIEPNATRYGTGLAFNPIKEEDARKTLITKYQATQSNSVPMIFNDFQEKK